MDPSDLPGYLEDIANRAAKGAAPAVLEMARDFEDYVRNVTLVRYGHPPGTRTPSPAGIGPPALVTGQLRDSVLISGVQLAPVVSRAAVAPHTPYAAIQEWGGDIRPVNKRYLSWVTDGRRYYSKHVHMPERPYMRPSVRQCITSGVFGRAAMRGFNAAVWGA